MVDFSGSVKLSEMHGQLRVLKKRAQKSEAREVNEAQQDAKKKELNDAYARVRRSVIQSINHSFDPEKQQTRIKLPLPEVESLKQPEKAFEPYKKFYAAHQKDMSAKLQGLRVFVRESLEKIQPLAPLVVIDKTIEETMAVSMRASFALVPNLLGKRFDYYLDAHESSEQPQKPVSQEISLASWVSQGGRFEKFSKEMHEVLLAELEVRLQPILGLVEAFNEEVSNNT